MAALPVLRSFLSLYTINKVKSQSTQSISQRDRYLALSFSSCNVTSKLKLDLPYTLWLKHVFTVALKICRAISFLTENFVYCFFFFFWFTWDVRASLRAPRLFPTTHWTSCKPRSRQGTAGVTGVHIEGRTRDGGGTSHTVDHSS
jgi:hypothetical protein